MRYPRIMVILSALSVLAATAFPQAGRSQLAGTAESVTVVASQEQPVDTSSARLGANVNEREVHSLPLNGRQLSQLYLQAPGSVNTGSGTFWDIRFNGRSNEQNVIRYDGVEG